MKKKISYILIMVILAMNTVSGFAAIKFSDVSSGHWAKDDIEKMADKGIIKGEFNDQTLKFTFKPNDKVTYVQAIQMIYKTLEASGKLKNKSGLVGKYNNILKSNQIPSWSYEAIAYGLEYQIVTTGDLSAFVKNGKQSYARKVDVAVFIGKALDMKDQLSTVPVVSFVDAESIITAALQYVDLLEEKKIVGGDDQGRFNPNMIINRAVMATMCSKTYDLLVKEPNVVDPTNPIGTKSIEGTIDYVSSDSKMMVVKDASGNTGSYTLNTAYIKKDGRYINIQELNNGQRVKLTFNTSGQVASVEVLGSTIGSNTDTNSPTEKQGIIDYIAESTRMIAVKNTNGATEGYNLSGVVIKKNGKTISIKDLNKGDGIKLIFTQKGELDTIEVNNAITNWEGRIESIVRYDSYYLMSIRNRDNLILKKELKIYDNTEIKYDDKDVSVSKLIAGEDIEVKFIGDRAIKIELESKEVVYDGILESAVLFKQYPMLRFSANNNQIMEFEIDDDVVIRRDRRRADLDDLSKGDIATITVQYGKVVEIIAAGREERTRDEGVIKQIIIGDPTKITIVTDEHKERTYEVDDAVDVEIDEKDAEIRDLELHYEVRLTLENGEVTDIRADKVSHKNTISGPIEKIYSDYKYLVIKQFDNVKNEYISQTIIVPDKATIVSNKGEKLRLGNLEKRTTIIVNGYYDDGNFVATNIIELD